MSEDKCEKLLQCYNRGCGKTYNPLENTDESCQHHPGLPYFHDVYKGWSCCNKKSVDFTEFLNIKGCTLSKHSNVKPPEPEKNTNDSNDEVVEVRAPIPVAMARPPIETPMNTIKAKVDDAFRVTIDSVKTSIAAVTVPEETADGIPVGTACKNHGCTASFKGTNVDNGECQYHPGVPIFHEGMKYWLCCKKKTSDFAAFMAQKGCAYGEHKWTKNEDKEVVECRYDWHQTASNVIVSIYAKKYHYAKSKIEVNPIRLHVRLVFPEQGNATYDLDLELHGVIDVTKTSALMLGTKIEIIMRKAEAGSWSKLDFPRTNLPPPKSSFDTNTKAAENDAESDDDGFNLDDIDIVKPGGLTISEIEEGID